MEISVVIREFLNELQEITPQKQVSVDMGDGTLRATISEDGTYRVGYKNIEDFVVWPPRNGTADDPQAVAAVVMFTIYAHIESQKPIPPEPDPWWPAFDEL